MSFIRIILILIKLSKVLEDRLELRILTLAFLRSVDGVGNA